MSEKRTVTQNNKIYEYMKQNGSITQLDAIRHFNCLRLSARIKDLRDMGINIISVKETTKHEDGTRSTYSRYSLAKA